MAINAMIKAITTALPEGIEYNNPDLRLTKKTGIFKRHIVGEKECASDLAMQAAEKLFLSMPFLREEIDFILLCTQSPDYFLPTTACLLQNRLGLSKHCGAFDLNLGCSGYVYGLSVAKGLIESQQAKKILLLTAETYSKFIHPQDHTVRPLFGDGATATLISAANGKEMLSSFVFGTDGSGADSLIVPAGGMRQRVVESEKNEPTDEGGRSAKNLYMDGGAISNFALSVVPNTVEEILGKSNLTRQDIDYYVFHQANKFMLEFLQQKCGLQGMPFWNKPEEYGNTVSNSIPLALAELVRESKTRILQKVMLVGFGVGLSWAGCMADLSETSSF